MLWRYSRPCDSQCSLLLGKRHSLATRPRLFRKLFQNRPGPCDCSRSVTSRNIRGFQVSNTNTFSYRERCRTYVNLQWLLAMGRKASFASGTCRLKTAFNLCLTSLKNTLSLAVGGLLIVTRAVAVNHILGCDCPTAWQFMTTGGGTPLVRDGL